MEALGRVELPTNGLGNRCSIHLSYRAARHRKRDCFSLPQSILWRGLFLLPNRCSTFNVHKREAAEIARATGIVRVAAEKSATAGPVASIELAAFAGVVYGVGCWLGL